MIRPRSGGETPQILFKDLANSLAAERGATLL
jgi:hypothetical protein